MCDVNEMNEWIGSEEAVQCSSGDGVAVESRGVLGAALPGVLNRWGGSRSSLRGVEEG